MKKSLFIVAAAAMMTACTSEVLREDYRQDDTQSAITFETFVQKAVNTRAEQSENNGLASSNALEAYNNSFVVNGFKKVTENGVQTESVVFDKKSVNYASGDWKYTPAQYWDKSADNYSFYAAAPASGWEFNPTKKTYSYANATVTGNTLAKLDAENVNASVVFASVNGIDLMISNDIPAYTGFKTDVSQAVHFYFNHILSRFNISVRIDETLASDDCKLYDLKIYNMYSQGSFDEAKASADATGNCARWTTASSDARLSNVGFHDASGDALKTTKQYYYQALCIPQTVKYAASGDCPINGSGLTSASAPYLNIKYSINGDKYSYYYNLADVLNGDTQNDITFCEGWMNTLHILISPAIITFDADVFDWNEKIKKEYTINQ